MAKQILVRSHDDCQQMIKSGTKKLTPRICPDRGVSTFS